jgi:hypothetical protein
MKGLLKNKKLLKVVKNETELGVVVRACNPSTWEAETGESKAWDQHGLQSRFVAT